MSIDYNKKPQYQRNPEFLRKAFVLYCQGLTGNEITRRLQKEWPGLCRQTVCKIIKNLDWEKQRARFIELQLDGADEKKKLVEELNANREKLFNTIHGPDQNHQHYAQYNNTIRLIMEIEGIGAGVGGGDMVLSNDLDMNAFLQALEEDEVLWPVFKKRKTAIRREFERKLKGAETGSGRGEETVRDDKGHNGHQE